MLGLLENERERSEVAKMSLEYAYTLWKEGKLRTLLAVHAAQVCQCECGNAIGLTCFSSAHAAMRQILNGGPKGDFETPREGIIFDDVATDDGVAQ
jgi:hypothetical protein